MFDILAGPDVTPLPLQDWLADLGHNGFAAWAKTLSTPLSFNTRLGERFLQADPTGAAPLGYYLHLDANTTLGTADIFLPLNLFETLSPPWSGLTNPAHFAASKSDVNANIVPLVVEFILAEALDAVDLGIHSAQGAVVKADAVHGATLRWFRVDPPKSHTIYINLSEPFAQHLVGRASIANDPYDALPMDLSLCVLGLWIMPQQLRDLGRGDVLCCGSATAPELFVHVGGGTFDVKTVRKKWQPCGAHTPLVYPINPKDSAMNDTEETDTLNVLLTFEVDRRTISLGDLRTLNAGSTFPVCKLDDAKITVRANGSAIGTGRLVQFDDQLAIQILEIDSCV